MTCHQCADDLSGTCSLHRRYAVDELNEPGDETMGLKAELAQCERLNQEVALLADQMREQRNEARRERDQFRLEWDAANARCNAFADGFHERNELLRKAEAERDAALAQVQALRGALELVRSISEDPRVASDRHLALMEDSPMMEEVRAALDGAPSEGKPCPICEGRGIDDEYGTTCQTCKGPPSEPQPCPRCEERWTFKEVCDALNVCESGHAKPHDGVPCDFKSLRTVLTLNRAALSKAGAK